MRVRRSSAALVVFLAGACSRPEPPPLAPVVWTDAAGRPIRDPGRTSESVRYRESQRVAPSGAAPVHSDRTTPRPRCNDGTHSAHYSPGNVGERDCCAGQGGLYRDPWGSIVYE
ncbi:MAG TPA: hypothetical protein VI299_23645 [Polyangiales bacterium]